MNTKFSITFVVALLAVFSFFVAPAGLQAASTLQIAPDGPHIYEPDPECASNTVLGTSLDDFLLSGLPGHNDTIKGLEGDDKLQGNDCNDLLIGGPGFDWLYGGDGEDELRGGDGPDYLQGDDGDDILRGGFGDDTIFGDLGNDIIFGGPGYDVCDGGGGIDTFYGCEEIKN